MILNKELLNYNNKLYWVYRRVRESSINIGKVNDAKELWLCDIVLKQRVQENDILIFLREIPDAEYVE
jgi:hypothetical protein